MIIKVGAEAIIIKENDKIIKRRIKKKYRIKEIDERFRKERTKREARILERVRRLGIKVPKVLEVKDFEIIMEYIEGRRLSEILEELDYKNIAKEMGKILALLHKNNIFHGDPTTSNFIYRDGEIYLIDFGLSGYSNRIEDFAVDILLLKRAILSKHPKIFESFWKEFQGSYLKNFEKGEDVLKRVEKIERRGRYIRRK